MKFKDYYEVLGVAREASADDIKRAYRKLAAEHHPDRGGDEEAFKRVSAAYDVLGNADKRAQYDAYRRAPQGAGNFSNIGLDLGDLFAQFFGGGAAQSRGPDVQYRFYGGGTSGADPFGGMRSPDKAWTYFTPLLTYGERVGDRRMLINPLFGGMRDFDDTFRNRLTTFIDQLNAGVRPADVDGSGADGLAAQKVLAAAIVSVREERVVEVAEIG